MEKQCKMKQNRTINNKNYNMKELKILNM